MLSPKQCLVRGEVKIQTQALWAWYLSLYSVCCSLAILSSGGGGGRGAVVIRMVSYPLDCNKIILFWTC